ncbi:zinc finger and scan domain-containing [Holotrichia oblita]|uniref:Zinc finger and scan domain-containing n=1 Tax=Holotrichia oblita TaxID=644536 RepID=A0ACB9SQR9_HOLOL|nr:zinc finger and scan domain-containing [Holotrichia oblita]
MNVCRLCLCKGDESQVQSIWTTQIEDLPNKIWSCVSIKINKNDNLPTTVCISCILQINRWVTFKQTCEKSNNILLNKLDSEGCVTDTTELFCQKDKHESSSWETTFEVFDKELQDVVVGTSSNYECEICKRTFDICTDYLDHQFEHNGALVFHCDKCPKVFDSREKIVEHDRKHKKPCSLCGKMILKSSMKLHLIQHTDRHRCTQCLNRFNSRASLQQHIITVHTDIKDYVCSTCGKKFSSKTSMRVHMKSHSNERLYKCKLCSYAGRTASAVYIHMSTHENYFCICEVCSKTFKSMRNLNDHLRRVHSETRKHECNYCGKKFIDKYILSVHIRRHTGARPYNVRYVRKLLLDQTV